ncbi:hypothetical protein [Porphyromonas somerae]|uniref:hypothetical protein n=1 Tax=Porphyromonas somerae TaxID=322095 RepID=UPI000372611B|nr:hypothetical protein [Porphyromonas somerae]BDE81892.1 hypothetical protein CE91St14_09200 [Porphyromonas somerae]
METQDYEKIESTVSDNAIDFDLLNENQTKRGREVVTDEDVAEVKDIVDEWLAGEGKEND